MQINTPSISQSCQSMRCIVRANYHGHLNAQLWFINCWVLRSKTVASGICLCEQMSNVRHVRNRPAGSISSEGSGSISSEGSGSSAIVCSDGALFGGKTVAVGESFCIMCCWIAEDMDMESARSGCLISIVSFNSPELSSSPVTVMLSASLRVGSLLKKQLVYYSS